MHKKCLNVQLQTRVQDLLVLISMRCKDSFSILFPKYYEPAVTIMFQRYPRYVFPKVASTCEKAHEDTQLVCLYLILGWSSTFAYWTFQGILSSVSNQEDFLRKMFSGCPSCLSSSFLQVLRLWRPSFMSFLVATGCIVRHHCKNT